MKDPNASPFPLETLQEVKFPADKRIMSRVSNPFPLDQALARTQRTPEGSELPPPIDPLLVIEVVLHVLEEEEAAFRGGRYPLATVLRKKAMKLLKDRLTLQ